MVDFGRSPNARRFGRYSTLNVRHGKAKKGLPRRRQNVLSVMDWAVKDYVELARTRSGFPDHPALWITARGGRLQPSSINDRFELYRDAHKLLKELCNTQFAILTFSITDLIPPLKERGITLLSSQVYRLVVKRPERLSLKILMALLDILDCTMDDLPTHRRARLRDEAEEGRRRRDFGMGRSR
ncbi:helix-turn-helix domain-containing protein [Streptomyces sp. NPDC086783]|uniref:helix-turn-helix domain-containing protein n=1 Tax=Streptomyces sp. NPDC086783 TaxID=3365758 RepID=UPI0037F45B23